MNHHRHLVAVMPPEKLELEKRLENIGNQVFIYSGSVQPKEAFNVGPCTVVGLSSPVSDRYALGSMTF